MLAAGHHELAVKLANRIVVYLFHSFVEQFFANAVLVGLSYQRFVINDVLERSVIVLVLGT